MIDLKIRVNSSLNILISNQWFVNPQICQNREKISFSKMIGVIGRTQKVIGRIILKNLYINSIWIWNRILPSMIHFSRLSN